MYKPYSNGHTIPKGIVVFSPFYRREVTEAQRV